MSGSDAPAGWSLRRRLAQVLVSTALLPVLLFSVTLLWSQWHDSRQDLQLRVDANARLNADGMDAFLEAQLAGVRMIADRIAEDPHSRNEDLASFLYVYPSALRVMQFSANGDEVAMRDARGRAQGLQQENVEGVAWFKEVRDRYRAHVSDAYQHIFYGSEAVVALSAPILRNKQFVGALQADIPIDGFTKTIADNLAQRGLGLLLLDRNNRVMYAGRGLRMEQLQDAGNIGRQLRGNAKPASQQSQVRLLDGLLQSEGQAFTSAVLMRNGWVLALVAPRELLLKPLVPRFALLAVLMFVTLLGLALSLWQQRQLLRKSIGYLLASLRGYALGGRMDPAQVDLMPDELRPLADGVAELGDRLNTTYAELQQVLEGREQVIAERTASLRQAVADLDRISRTDALTGCLNYRGFTETGDRLWKQALKEQTPLSVLALDIDHFKLYNDLYGHAEGDSVLRRFAGAVRSALLHSDDVLARPGGEEFTIFLPNTTHAQALHVGERVVQRVRDADMQHAGSLKGHVTVSVGVATLEPSDNELEDILKRADAALYRVKASGRDGFGD